MDAIGDEVECRAALHHEGFACVVRKHEHGPVIPRFLALTMRREDGIAGLAADAIEDSGRLGTVLRDRRLL